MTKPTIPDDLAAALADLPVLPRADAVLFPTARLVVEVVEQGHRALVQAALDRQGALAVAYPVQGSPQGAGPAAPPPSDARPPLRPIAGVGTIVERSPLSGGRDRLVVLGRARVRLQELSFVPPFQRAIATLLRCPEGGVPEGELLALHAAAASFANLMQARDPGFALRLPSGCAPGVLIDSCADQLVLDAGQRQRVLETLDLRGRARLVTEVLTMQEATLGPDHRPTN